MNNELDPTRPVMMTAFPDAECKVLGTINSLFPLIIAVTFPGMYDVLYHVDPSDGTAISAFERGVFNFVNRE